METADSATAPRVIERHELPWALRAVAFAFLLVGALSLVDIVLRLVVLHEVFLNLGVVGLLLGNRLFRLRNRWRVCCILAIWTQIIVFGFLLLTSVLQLLPNNWRLLRVEQPWATGLVGLLLALLVWQVYVLQRADVIQLFKLVTQGRAKVAILRRFQFRLSTLLWAMLVASFGLAQLSSHEYQYESSSIGYAKSTDSATQRILQYRYLHARYPFVQDELDYALFFMETSKEHPDRRTYSKFPVDIIGDAVFILHHRRKLTHNRGGKLYEWIDGEFRTVEAQISRNEFEAYLQSVGADGTIDGLLEFCRQRREEESGDAKP